jgi:glycosyltransferase involved in cell wall biosynthesis
MKSRPRILIIDNLAVEASRRSVYRLLSVAFEVHLLVPEKWRETAGIKNCEPEVGSELTVHTSPILFGFRHHRMLYTRLGRVLNEVRPDLVLAVHAPENYATLQLLLHCKFGGRKAKIALLASRNIDLPIVGFPFRFAVLNRFCDAMTARIRVDGIFHRPKSFSHLYDRYTTRKIYIPHSVDCKVFTPKNELRNQQHFVIGYVGRLTPEKGVNVLIDAFAGMMVPARLRILGEGPQESELRTLVQQSNLKDRVSFDGLTPYAQMPDRIRALDVLVLPSLETRAWKELFGRVLIEAMACGVPVVASDSGGISEVVGDAGVLVPPGDAQRLRSTLEYLAGNTDARSALANSGRTRVLQLFDTPVVASALAGGLRQILTD